MKIEKMAIYLDEQQMLEMEAIVLDEDEKAALEFLKQLKKRLDLLQRQHCGTPLVKGE